MDVIDFSAGRHIPAAPDCNNICRLAMDVVLSQLSKAPKPEGVDLPYMNTESRTPITPKRKKMEGYCPNSGMAPMTVKMTDRALAKFLRMLSAYFTTMPTINPPKIWRATTVHASVSNPYTCRLCFAGDCTKCI